MDISSIRIIDEGARFYGNSKDALTTKNTIVDAVQTLIEVGLAGIEYLDDSLTIVLKGDYATDTEGLMIEFGYQATTTKKAR